jgi:hypothetical protein
MAIFSPDVIFVDGQLVAKATSISVENPDNDTNVETIVGGVEGPAPGAKQTTISLNEVVPKGGSTFSWEKRWRESATVEIIVQQIGSSEKLSGTFLVASISRSASSGNPVAKDITLKSIGQSPPIVE